LHWGIEALGTGFFLMEIYYWAWDFDKLEMGFGKKRVLKNRIII